MPAALAVARGVPAFVAGYLAVWAVAGLAAYLVADRMGHAVAVAVILVAAAYQLTATKTTCLERCRNSAIGGLRGGLRHGASCVGCCAGLMAALFALGVMSLAWMAVVAALIAAERVLPWRTPAVYGVAVTLALLAIVVAV